MIAVSNSFVGYYISMDVIVALMFDKRLGNCQIPKRQVTPFLYIGSRPAASTLELRHSCVPMAASQQSRSGSENDAKIRFF